MDQVDWLEVAVKVAENRPPSVYCNAIEKILLARIFHLVKSECEKNYAVQSQHGNSDKEHVPVPESCNEKVKIRNGTARYKHEEFTDEVNGGNYKESNELDFQE